MLSLIVLSNRDDRFHQLVANVAETVGCEYEILRENDVQEGLCRAYNETAFKAKFKNLCFVHDDVLFHTANWGKKIITQLNEAQTGVVGVMGSRYKSFFGAGWRDGEWTSFRMNVVDAASGKRLVCNPNKEQQSEIICLDGAFLCCTKEHWRQHPFDEQTFSGFHFYDVDICLRMHKAGLKNYALFGFEMAHFSQGRKDSAFINAYLSFQSKWQSDLPVSLDPMNRKGRADLEGYSLAQTVQLMKQNGFSKAERRKQIQLYWQRYKNWYHVLRSVYFGFL